MKVLIPSGGSIGAEDYGIVPRLIKGQQFQLPEGSYVFP